MPENIKLSFDDGCKTIEFNGDPNKVIRFNPTDMAFVNRIAGLEEKAKEIAEKYGDIDLSHIDELKNISADDPDFDKLKAAADTIGKVERSIRELIDSTFGTPVCDIVFGNTNCLSPANGTPIYINFIQSIFGYIKDELDKQNAKSEAKMSKYTIAAQSVSAKPKITAKPFIPYADPKPDPSIDISSLSPEEKDLLLRQLIK